MTPVKLTQPKYSFTESDAQKAFDDWGCNCGPTALATMTGVSLDYVHPLIPQFDEREYTNPTMMDKALSAMGVPWKERELTGGDILEDLSTEVEAKDDFKPHVLTRYGLVRIQWEGPWYGRFAYHKTHWIGAMEYRGNVYVFDCNGGWMLQSRWESEIVPILTTMYKRATGGWNATHRWELWS